MLDIISSITKNTIIHQTNKKNNLYLIIINYYIYIYYYIIKLPKKKKTNVRFEDRMISHSMSTVPKTKIYTVYPRVRGPVSSLTASLSFFVSPSRSGGPRVFLACDQIPLKYRLARTGICLAYSGRTCRGQVRQVAELSIIGPLVFPDSWPHFGEAIYH